MFRLLFYKTKRCAVGDRRTFLLSVTVISTKKRGAGVPYLCFIYTVELYTAIVIHCHALLLRRIFIRGRVKRATIACSDVDVALKKRNTLATINTIHVFSLRNDFSLRHDSIVM